MLLREVEIKMMKQLTNEPIYILIDKRDKRSSHEVVTKA